MKTHVGWGCAIRGRAHLHPYHTPPSFLYLHLKCPPYTLFLTVKQISYKHLSIRSSIDTKLKERKLVNLKYLDMWKYFSHSMTVINGGSQPLSSDIQVCHQMLKYTAKYIKETFLPFFDHLVCRQTYFTKSVRSELKQVEKHWIRHYR